MALCVGCNDLNALTVVLYVSLFVISSVSFFAAVSGLNLPTSSGHSCLFSNLLGMA